MDTINIDIIENVTEVSVNVVESIEEVSVVVSGTRGDQGVQGVKGEDGYTPIKGIDYNDGSQGIQGNPGEKGDKGDPGTGLIPGGSATQVLAKKTISDYDTEWVDRVSGNDTNIQFNDSGNLGSSSNLSFDKSSNQLMLNGINIDMPISNGVSTGLLVGGIVSVNENNTKFDIGSGAGWVIDNYTNALNPTRKLVYWDSMLGEDPAYMSSSITYFAINSSGSLVQSNAIFNQSQMRDYIFLGAIGHPNHSTIDYAVPYPSISFDTGKTLEDFLNAFGAFNLDGNVYSASGSNLYISKSSGKTFSYGANYGENAQSPNVIIDPVLNPAVFIYTNRTSGSIWNNSSATISIDPNNYDSGSSLSLVTSGSFTIQQLYYYTGVGLQLTAIIYGQSVYSTMSEAESNLSSVTVNNPDLTQAVFRGWLILQQGTIDLSNPIKAKFISSGRLGTTSIGGTSSITDHSLMSNLNYASSGHTGFQPSGSYLTTEGDPIFSSSEAFKFLNGDKNKLDGIASGAEVNVNADWESISGDSQILNKPIIDLSVMSTSLLSGGIMSINANGSTIDISDSQGLIVDNYTDSMNPTITRIHYHGGVGIQVPYLSTAQYSSVGINSSGSIVFRSGDFTTEERRDNIIIGYVTHVSGSAVEYVYNEAVWGSDIFQQFNDFMESFGAFNITGNEYGASGSTLQVQKSAGQTFDNGTNYPNSKKNPNIFTNEAENPVDIYYYYRSGSSTWVNDNTAVTEIDPNHYDSGSSLSDVPTGKWTVQPILFYSSTYTTDIQYGQEVYDSLDLAKSSLNSPVEMNPYNSSDTFRAWLIVKQGATNLSNIEQASFVSAGKLGLVSTASGGGVGGEINTASNIGTAGIGIYNDKIGVDLRLKNLQSGTGISITDNPTEKSVLITNTKPMDEGFVVAMSVALGGG